MIDSLFGSKTRVKLLYLFMSNPGRAFYVREITRRVDEQINSVRRELANMLSVGVIKSDSIDNKLYYEVDQNYVYYTSLKGIFADTSTETSEKAHVAVSTDWSKRLKKLSGTKIVILAGGFVSGARSKVDITIIGNPPKLQVRKFIKEIEEDEHRAVAYSVLSFDDFYYRLSMKDRFISEIIDGKHQVVLDTTGKLKVTKEK
mgnify:CR=1 FL=1